MVPFLLQHHSDVSDPPWSLSPSTQAAGSQHQHWAQCHHSSSVRGWGTLSPLVVWSLNSLSISLFGGSLPSPFSEAGSQEEQPSACWSQSSKPSAITDHRVNNWQHKSVMLSQVSWQVPVCWHAVLPLLWEIRGGGWGQSPAVPIYSGHGSSLGSGWRTQLSKRNRWAHKWHTAGAQGRNTCRKPRWPFPITLLVEPWVGEPLGTVFRPILFQLASSVLVCICILNHYRLHLSDRMWFLYSTGNIFRLFLFSHIHPTFQGGRGWSNNI